MKWLVAALYTFSAVVMFVSITFIYNLNKKKVEQMNMELAERRGSAVIVENLTTEEALRGVADCVTDPDYTAPETNPDEQQE